MFTVVIAEQKHIKKIKEYDNFLKPLLKSKNIAICQWDTEGKSIETAVPTLYKTVGNRSDWNALILVDFLPKEVQNPYDFVKHDTRKNISDMDNEEQETEMEKRRESYKKAAENPLTVLSNWLCGVLNEPDDDDKALADEGGSFGLFYKEKVAKYEVLSEICKEDLLVTKPKKIFCLATRIYKNETKELKESWANHDEIDYSEFCSYNLYPDPMRYLLYDIVPEDNYNYNLDYWKFLCTMLILATNEIPENALTKERVYSLECNSDNEALAYLLYGYNDKLRKTKSQISAKIRNLEHSFERQIGEVEFEQRYLTSEDIGLYAANEVDTTEMKVDTKPVGLSKDCPENEMNFWGREEGKTRKVFNRFLKQPRRTLDKAVSDTLMTSGVDEEGVLSLDKFQIQDIKDYADDNELKMSEIDTSNIYDVSDFNNRLDEKSKSVKDTIATRMTKGKTLAVAGIILFCFLFGSIPFIIKMFKNSESLGYSIPILLGGIALLGLVLYIVLKVFKRRLLDKMEGYNDTMHDIEGEVDNTIEQFGEYLSAAKTMRNSNEALNIYYGGEDTRTVNIKLMKMHINEINDLINDNNNIINQIAPQSEPPEMNNEPYDYDFTRRASYDYPLPMENGESRNIDYIQEEYKVQVPIDYIESIVAVREEIYE